MCGNYKVIYELLKFTLQPCAFLTSAPCTGNSQLSPGQSTPAKEAPYARARRLAGPHSTSGKQSFSCKHESCISGSSSITVVVLTNYTIPFHSLCVKKNS